MEKLIGIAGYECEDIGLYLARLLSGLGQKVALVDRTEQEMLLEILEVSEEKEKGVRETEISGILITNQRVCLQAFDRIIYLFGLRLTHPRLYECETVLLVSDGIPAHANLLGKMEPWNRRKFLVLRNMIPMKHSEKYLAMLADSEKCYCEIPYEEKDLRMRGSLSSLNYGNMNGLSVGMKRALIQMVQFIFPGSNDKEIWKLIKG